MFPQWFKGFYYATVGHLTILNYYRYRVFPRMLPPGRKVLHLGCGQNYLSLPGFVNIDGNICCRKDIWLDVTMGLPYPDQTIDAIYAHHFLEHLEERGIRRVLLEAYRVLKPGGGIRLVTPDLGKAVRAYAAKDHHFFSGWPDPRQSIGGKFNNYLLCRNQHRFMFDLGFLEEFLRNAGLEKCQEVGPLESRIFCREELEGVLEEGPETHRSLFVEAFKGGPEPNL